MKTLIIGASGFLGSRIMDEAQIPGRRIGTYYLRPRANLVSLCLDRPDDVRSFCGKLAPDVIIHCGGITRPVPCERDRERAWLVNVIGIRAALEGAPSAKIVYFSTDYVFDGEHGPYDEDAVPSPINEYGKTKRAAEEVVLNHSHENLVVRVAGLYGINESCNQFMHSLTQHREVSAAVDLLGSQTYLDDIVTRLSELIGFCGTVHCACPWEISRFDFLTLAARSLDLECKVIPVRATDCKDGILRPANSTLMSKRLDWEFRRPVEGLALMRCGGRPTAVGSDR